MNTDWFSAAPALIAALALLFVPGALSLRAIGLRGLPLLAAAPLMSVATIAIAGIALSLFGIGWSLLSAIVVILAIVAVAWGVGLSIGPVRAVPASSAPVWVMPAALIIGIGLGVMRLTGYIGDPAGISQTNDAVFHMNAVRYMLETSDASSLSVNGLVDGSGFYPAAWHAIVSLIVLASGAEIAVAANALTVVIGAVVWTLGIAWFARIVTGSQTVAAYAAVLSSALQTFPLLMFQWGVLFPNALSTALIPAAVALTISVRTWSVPGSAGRNTVRAVLLVAITGAALALTQPAGLLPWAAICLVWLTAWLLTSEMPWPLFARIAVIVAGWAGLLAVWLFLSSFTSGSHWPPFRSIFDAVVDVLLNGQMRVPVAFGISALMIIGLVVAVGRRGLRWFAVTWLGISGVYIVLASVGNPFIRDVLFGAWYADPNRVASLAPIVVIPLAAIGIDAIVGWIARLGRAEASTRARWIVIPLTVVTAFMTVLAIVRPVPMLDFPNARFFFQSRYDVDQRTFLDLDERALLESLPEYVGADDRVIANPGTGAGFGYMLSGLDVYPRTWAPPATAEWDVLAQRLHEAASDPSVCEALMAYDTPEFVLDFGRGSTEPGRYVMPGMTGFADSDGFEMVAREGDASLWRITACR